MSFNCISIYSVILLGMLAIPGPILASMQMSTIALFLLKILRTGGGKKGMDGMDGMGESRGGST